MPGRGSRAQAGAAALLVGAMAWRVSGPAHVARDISLAMDLIGDPYYDRLRQAVGLAEAKDSSYAAAPEVANEEELAMLLRSRVPFLLALIGVVGLGLISGSWSSSRCSSHGRVECELLTGLCLLSAPVP